MFMNMFRDDLKPEIQFFKSGFVQFSRLSGLSGCFFDGFMIPAEGSERGELGSPVMHGHLLPVFCDVTGQVNEVIITVRISPVHFL
jgi:hypothetical protein